MALIKDITDNRGVVTGYHNIFRYNVAKNGSFEIYVASYVSQAVRESEGPGQEGSRAVSFRSVSGGRDQCPFTLDELDPQDHNPYTAAYAYIRANELDFADATDDVADPSPVA